MTIILHDTGRYQLKQLAVDHFVVVDNECDDMARYIIKSSKTLRPSLNFIHKLEVSR